MLASSRQFGSTNAYTESKLGKRSDEQKAQDCEKYLEVLAQQRLFWEPMLDNIIQFVNPGRRYIQDRDLQDGQQTGQETYDDAAPLARNKLVDGMTGNIFPREQEWFGLELPGRLNFPRTSGMRAWNGQRLDSYPQVQKWLQDCKEVMYSAFNRSNFYDKAPEFISDGATCGTSYFLVEEDIKNARAVFTVPHFRECYIAENEFGQVDTNYRVYKMTLRQMVEKFGMEEMVKADNNFKKDYERNMYAERDICHAIYPRADYQPGRIDAKGKEWESVWLYRKGGKILGVDGKPNTATGGGPKVCVVQEGGYDSMPIFTWRWRKNSDEVYGRGPGHDAFIAIALANQMGLTNLKVGQQAAEPPLVAYADQRGAIQRGANGITYLESNRGDIRLRMPQQLTTGVQNLPFTVEYQDRRAAIINEYFYTDVFQKMSQLAAQGKSERMVQEQVQEIQGEKAAVLGTRVGNLQTEALNPIMDRMYRIEAAAGRIPTPPDILLQSSHSKVEIQYLGPLAQAQTRLTKVRGMTSFLGLTTQLSQIDPSIPHAINSRYMLKEFAESVNVPVDCLYDDKTYAGIMQSLQQQAKQEQTAENIPKLAGAAAKLAKAPEAGSILQNLMSGGDNAGAA